MLGPVFLTLAGLLFTQGTVCQMKPKTKIFIYIYVLKKLMHIYALYTLIHGRSEPMTHDRLELTPQILNLNVSAMLGIGFPYNHYLLGKISQPAGPDRSL